MTETTNTIEEKKQRIIDSALEEFAEKGYASASTNSISQLADVSKGLIFHYYGSKKNLYLTLVKMCIEQLREAVDLTVTDNNDNFLEYLKKAGQNKTLYYIKNPSHYKLMYEAFYNTPSGVTKEIHEMYSELTKKSYEIIYSKLNDLPLREGVDRNMALELIMMVVDLVEKKYITKLQYEKDHGYSQIQEMGDEIIKYFDLLMKGIG